MNLHDNSPKFIPKLGSTPASRIPRIPTALLKVIRLATLRKNAQWTRPSWQQPRIGSFQVSP